MNVSGCSREEHQPRSSASHVVHPRLLALGAPRALPHRTSLGQAGKTLANEEPARQRLR